MAGAESGGKLSLLRDRARTHPSTLMPSQNDSMHSEGRLSEKASDTRIAAAPAALAAE